MNGKVMKITIRVILTVMILSFLIFTLSTFTQSDKSKMNIMFIAKSSQSNFWKTAFQGARAAGNEYNVNVIIQAPETEEDYGKQNEMLQWAIDNSVDAVVFSACDFDKSVKAAERVIDAGIPVISIDSPINSSKELMMIGTDNILAGVQAGEKLAELTDYKGKVGIINFEEGSANGMQRERGCLDAILKYPNMEVVDIRYTLSNIENPKLNTIDMLKENPEINAIATFNEWTTLGVGEALKEMDIDKDKIAVIGFDNNLKSIEQLERGIFDGLIVQNPFAMGYIGIQQAIEYKKNKQHEDFIDTGTKVITAENMYNIENQKLLFPFSNVK